MTKNIASVLSIFSFSTTGVRKMSIPIPYVRLFMFAPMMFPRATFPAPFIAENIEFAISGIDVATAASVNPTNKLLKWNREASLFSPIIIKFAPRMSIISDIASVSIGFIFYQVCFIDVLL